MSSFSSPQRCDCCVYIPGLVYGAAIGDAIGLSCRWMSADECAFHYGDDELVYGQIVQDEHRVMWTRGNWTSNFEQLVSGLNMGQFVSVPSWCSPFWQGSCLLSPLTFLCLLDFFSFISLSLFAFNGFLSFLPQFFFHLSICCLFFSVLTFPYFTNFADVVVWLT